MADNKLAIVGLLLVLIPIVISAFVFVYYFILTFIHDIRHHGWKYALKESGGIFAIISICLGFILIALSYCIE